VWGENPHPKLTGVVTGVRPLGGILGLEKSQFYGHSPPPLPTHTLSTPLNKFLRLYGSAERHFPAEGLVVAIIKKDAVGLNNRGRIGILVVLFFALRSVFVN